jgi:hypothetical protein
MRQKASERSSELDQNLMGEQDSPAIENLIEQLNRDLEETQRSVSKAK